MLFFFFSRQMKFPNYVKYKASLYWKDLDIETC